MVEQKVKDAVKTLSIYVHDAENECEECNTQSLDRVSTLLLKVKELEKENEKLKAYNFALIAQIKTNVSTFQALFPEDIKPKLPTVCPQGFKFRKDWGVHKFCLECNLYSECEKEEANLKLPTVCPYGHEFEKDWQAYKICLNCNLTKKCEKEGD